MDKINGVDPSFGGYKYSSSRGDFVSASGKLCQLRRRSFQVFYYLTQHPQKIVSKDELLKAIWGNTIVTDDSLTQCVCEIRKAIQDTDHSILKTIPKRGYILNPDQDCAQSERPQSASVNGDEFPSSGLDSDNNQQAECKLSHSTISNSQHKFVVGPPVCTPELFYGREAFLSRIFGAWQQPPFGHISIIGPRRSGKTSLLQHLKPISGACDFPSRKNQKTRWLAEAGNYRWIYIDFQDPRMRSSSSLLSYLLKNLDLPTSEACTLEMFMERVTEKTWTIPTLILMDELEAGLASSELDQPFWWALRSLTQMTDGLIGFALASHQNPMKVADSLDKTSPFFNIFTTLELGPFEEAEALEFIDSINEHYTHGERRWILEESGCWPCLLQLLCQEKYLAVRNNNRVETWQHNARYHLENYAKLLR